MSAMYWKKIGSYNWLFFLTNSGALTTRSSSRTGKSLLHKINVDPSILLHPRKPGTLYCVFTSKAFLIISQAHYCVRWHGQSSMCTRLSLLQPKHGGQFIIMKLHFPLLYFCSHDFFCYQTHLTRLLSQCQNLFTSKLMTYYKFPYLL